MTQMDWPSPNEPFRTSSERNSNCKEVVIVIINSLALLSDSLEPRLPFQLSVDCMQYVKSVLQATESWKGSLGLRLA